MLIINLTQHTATPEQMAAGVRDLPPAEREMLVHALTIEELPSPKDILDRAATVALLAVNNGLGADNGDDPHPAQAMIGGPPWMMRALEDAVLDQGVEPVYAFARRDSHEQAQPDGSIKKTTVFRHAGFLPRIDLDTQGYAAAPAAPQPE